MTRQNHTMNTAAVILWNLLIYERAAQSIPQCGVAAWKWWGHRIAQGGVGEALRFAWGVYRTLLLHPPAERGAAQQRLSGVMPASENFNPSVLRAGNYTNTKWPSISRKGFIKLELAPPQKLQGNTAKPAQHLEGRWDVHLWLLIQAAVHKNRTTE